MTRDDEDEDKEEKEKKEDGDRAAAFPHACPPPPPATVIAVVASIVAGLGVGPGPDIRFGTRKAAGRDEGPPPIGMAARPGKQRARRTSADMVPSFLHSHPCLSRSTPFATNILPAPSPAPL